MDSESLDRCIQTALASLYPPFQLTSPTVLCQVLSVVEHCYRGDGLRYLIHFLLPAKNFLQNLQQDACVQFSGLLFRHEGWPLCVHEKVVVQLCPLDQRLLRPGDFYLLVSPAVAPPPPRSHGASCRGGASVAPRLLLCSASAGGHHVEQQEVSQLALRSLFSMAWLDSVNRERERRGAPRLERCLLSAHGDVFRVPWEDLVYPQFISRPRPAATKDKEPCSQEGDVLLNTSHDLCRDTNCSGQDRKLLPPLTKTDQSAASSDGEESEGEYVELTELPRFSPQKGSLTQSISLQHRARTTHTATGHTPGTHTPGTHTATGHTPGTHTATGYTPGTHTTTGHTPVTHTTTGHTPVTHTATGHTPGTHTTTGHTPVTHTTTGHTLVTHTATGHTAGTHTPGTHTTTGHTPGTHTATGHTPGIHTPTGHTPGTHTATGHTPGTHTATGHTPGTHTATTHINATNTPPAAEAHTPHTTNTHSAATTHTSGTTHSSQPGVEVGSRLSEENQNQNQNQDQDQDSCAAVVYCQKEPTEGTEPGRSQNQNQNPEPETRTEQREQEQTERRNEAVESEGEEEVKEEDQCRRNQDEGEETEEEEELEDEGVEEVELEEEVQVIIMQQSLERKEEVVEEEETGGERGERGGAHIEKDCFTENNTQHTHTDRCPGNNTTDTHLENSPSEEEEEESSVCHVLTEESEESSIHKGLPEEEESSVLPFLPEESESPRCASFLAVDEPDQSDSGLEKLEEEKQEVGAGGAAERHPEALSSPPPPHSEFSVSAASSPTEPEQPAAAPTVPVRLSQSSQSSQLRFYSVLLRSGAVCLPGSTDRAGRVLLTVSTCSSVWSNPDCDGAELFRLLLYYTSTLRKETRASGLTVLMDARRAAPAAAVFSALRSLQEVSPGSIHAVLILANKDSTPRLDKPAATQVEVLNSLKSLQKHVELHQLPAQFGGSFSFSQNSWISFRSRVEQLTNQCEDVINLLQKTINILQATPLPAAAQDAELLLSRYRSVMRSILEDSRLVQLQQEGGASLSRLRREEGGVGATEEQRAAVEAVTSLYNQVDELLHRLVTLSNSRTQELNFIRDFRGLEQGFNQVRSWLQDVGEVRLKTLDEPEDSLELLTRKQQEFKEFYTTAYEQCKRGEDLLSGLDRWSEVRSADLQVYEVKVHSFWVQLQDFSQRVDITGQNLDRAVQLYHFLDQAYGWALEGMRHLAGISMEECTLPDKCQAVIGCLEEYHRQHPPIPDSRFQEMKAAAGELRGERGLRQWSFAWSKCQETKKMFDRKMEAALRTRDSAHRRRSDSALSWSSASSRKSLSGLWGLRETSSSSSSCPPEEDAVGSSPPRSSTSLLPVPSTPPRSSAPLPPLTSSPRSSTSPPTPQHTPLLQRLFRSSSSSEESSDRVEVCSSSPSLPRLGSSSSILSSCRRQQLRKTQSFDCPSTPSTPETSRYGPCPRALSEPVRRGNTGVFIRGLEVSSTEASDHTLCPRTAAHGWAGTGPRSPGTPGTPRTPGTPADLRPRGSKLRHIVEEMVTTEREYVRSLRYIIHHYFPEMDRGDLPQDLRGKRSVVFGNLEKLLDFHSQFFLRELEACWKHPLRVPHCFLRHQEQFGLYALYSKNKPKSDALLAHHGHSFFRRKQLELGDKMDLSSYLLKPIQRMSKYALLLSDLMKEVGVAQEAELVALQAATNMVKFQLRHGNDLLAMDAIRDCDVNLKEQGQLIRQDEFTVCSGRRKCQRHIFLFEELVLFSKPKKMEGGLDVFIYKHSFKTADVGLTESTGDSGLRFEIWFRRRTSKNQTFILQASSADVKHAWTSDIARILWTQATRNKEMRLKEMVSMGVGNKPFLDIQPSDAAISDRAVHYIMKSRGARTRASIAVSVFDHSNPFKRGAVSSDSAASGPSSSSLLGPLNLHMYSQTLPSPPDAQSSFNTSCIEEDEQEHETSSQPSMTTESSGSSSRCLSGSTGSDSGCVSSHLQEALQEEPRPHSQNSASCSSSSKQRISSQYISPKAAAVISPATVV